jgi:hypothetical protein
MPNKIKQNHDDNIGLGNSDKLNLNEIRILASNEKSAEMLLIIRNRIEKVNKLNDTKTLINLIGLEIAQLFHDKKNFPEVLSSFQKMFELSKKINYQNGLAFSYTFLWYIEKFNGNIEKSRKAIQEAIKLLKSSSEFDEYIHNVCYYCFAMDLWLEDHSTHAIDIFERCLDYFLDNGFHKNIVQTLGILIVAYQRTQSKKRALKVSKKLLNTKLFLDKNQEEIQIIGYYLAGVGQSLIHNLKTAEKLFEESYEIINKKLEQSNYYSYYYFRLLAHLAVVQALQGKIHVASEKVRIIENLLENESFKRKLDRSSKIQLPHTLNLIKFYINSRKTSFYYNENQKLILKICSGIKDNYSDSILLSEFLLNANLNYKDLLDLKNYDNASLRRVNHIIEYLIEKIKLKEKEINESDIFLELLNINKIKRNYTFIEQVLVDLLIAKEFYSREEYSKIHPLLKRYKNHLNRIEVLELRIFMEAFIQVGEFNNGDPLAPALHFMAIKRCREHNFSRLEGILLDHQQTLRRIALNRLL